MVEGQLSKTYHDWYAYLWSSLAIASFHLAYLVPPLAFLMVLFAFALIKLTELPTAACRLLHWPGHRPRLLCPAPLVLLGHLSLGRRLPLADPRHLGCLLPPHRLARPPRAGHPHLGLCPRTPNPLDRLGILSRVSCTT